MVKLGRASEVAREVAAESGEGGATDSLLADYAITPQHATTARTPAPQTDRLVDNNIMASMFSYLL